MGGGEDEEKGGGGGGGEGQRIEGMPQRTEMSGERWMKGRREG